jgi:hypothetical protein
LAAYEMAPGGTQMYGEFEWPRQFAVRGLGPPQLHELGTGPIGSEVSLWGYWEKGPNSHSPAYHDIRVARYRHGWPAYAAQYWWEADGSLHGRIAGALRAPTWLGQNGWTRTTRFRCLPLLVLWPGFALDTAFYGTIVFLLWSAPGMIRRRTRKRRGHCPTCNYDLRATSAAPCPECGSPPPTASTPSSGGPAQPARSA